MAQMHGPYQPTLRVFERKILFKIFSLVRVGDDFRIRYVDINDLDVMQRINIQWLSWLGHVVRMEKDAPVRRVFDTGIYGIVLFSEALIFEPLLFMRMLS